MPDIPQVPGVPALASYAANSIVLLVGDLIGALLGFSGSQWGIFLGGVPVIQADNYVIFDHKQEFPISDYPVEDGGFQSYDKVQLPAEITVRVSAGGSDADRQAFLASIDAVMNTLDLYDVVTPETVYQSYNFTHRDLHRTAVDGVGLIKVDLHLREVRVTATSTLSNTMSPTVAGQQNIGTVSGQSGGSLQSSGLQIQ